MTGRNDPCPCGSGKKYKKCCLAKELASGSRRPAAKAGPKLVTAGTPADVDELESNLEPAALTRGQTKYEPDPRVERADAFWERFSAASYEEKWTLVEQMLDEEPELCDGGMLYEISADLFYEAAAAGEPARFKEFLDRVEERAPEAYKQELESMLEYRINLALVEGNEADVERYFYEFSPMAGRHMHLYNQIISKLAYYGKQAVLHKGMRRAWPFVAEADDSLLEDFSLEDFSAEFSEALGEIELLQLLDENPNLTVEDATLQQRFGEYKLTILPEKLAILLDYRTGRKIPSWTIEDFHFKSRKKNDPARDRFTYLLAAFTHYAHHQEGVARTKVEMAQDELADYLYERHTGELGRPEAGNRQHRKRTSKQKTGQTPFRHPLRPDAKTLDAYLGHRLSLFEFSPYEAAALFELIPAWLRFLTRYGLLDEESRQQTTEACRPLKGDLIKFFSTHLVDQTVQRNLADWPYETGTAGA